MKEKIINTLLNLIKVKSIVTFATVGVMIYLVVTKQIEEATATALIMMVFQNLFNKDKKDSDINE